MADHRIFKYSIDLDRRTQNIAMPKDAKVLSAQMQHGQCQLWAMVDNSKAPYPRRIEVLPTGAFVERADRLSFLGTVQVNDGGSPLVFHIFERLS